MASSIRNGDGNSSLSGPNLSTKTKKGVITGSILGSITGLAVLGCSAYFLMKHCRNQRQKAYSKHEGNHEPPQYDSYRESSSIEPFYSVTDRWFQNTHIPQIKEVPMHDGIASPASISMTNRDALRFDDVFESDRDSHNGDIQSYWPTETSTLATVRSIADSMRRARGLRAERIPSSSHLMTLIRNHDRSLRNEVENLRREVEMMRVGGHESELNVLPPKYMAETRNRQA